MKLGTLFSSSPAEAPKPSAVRAARIANARRNTKWTEIQETALIRRSRFFVHADTDELFTLYRGTVFLTGSASIAASDFAPLYFFVDPDGDLVFLEKQRQTWSEVYARQCQREAARR